MQAPIPVTRKLALDLIADAIADHILAQIARDAQTKPQAQTEPLSLTSTKPPRAGQRQPTERAAKK